MKKVTDETVTMISKSENIHATTTASQLRNSLTYSMRHDIRLWRIEFLSEGGIYGVRYLYNFYFMWVYYSKKIPDSELKIILEKFFE